MRPDGIWHPRLMAILTGLGHTDAIVIADAGLPVPPGVEHIDLLWRRGEPGFLPVLEAVLAEATFEKAVYASEIAEPETLSGMTAALVGLTVETVPHEEFKKRTAAARVIVRTGEATPYANLLLYAGVPF
ncbi:D-ribose pyranase [Nocardia heshunensis]